MSEDQEAWDRFAAAALTGILALHANPDAMYPLVEKNAISLSTDASLYADAMMAERDKRIKANNDKPIF